MIAVEIFAAIVRSAPYGRYTARAQFDIGRAREKQGAGDLAVNAYAAVVEKFPNDPLAVDAQYQIGYIWLKAAQRRQLRSNARRTGANRFPGFPFPFPEEREGAAGPGKPAQAQSAPNRQFARGREVLRSQKQYRAAVIYYNEVIRQQPGSSASEQAKKRIDQLRAKVGDKALESAASHRRAEAKKHPKKPVAQALRYPAPPPHEEREPTRPDMRTDSSEVAPLPPSADSLPPPASADRLARRSLPRCRNRRTPAPSAELPTRK